MSRIRSSSHSLAAVNHPGHWRHLVPWPKSEHHKYHRGYTLVIGGAATHAGAAKLAALAALRTGSGLVSIVSAAEDVSVYTGSALSLMTETQDHWNALLKDERKNTVLIGPGAGVSKKTRLQVLAALKAKKRAVLDADALTSFADTPQTFFKALDKNPFCILTPHEGEFARLFGNSKKDRLPKALSAAQQANAVIVLKGHETVIASPDGRAAVNTNAPATLATAGAGDVLSGICAGFLAQGMEAFEAACAGVWVHAECANRQKAGLIAEDLLTHLPQVLQSLKEEI